jgi:hypothetical protein
VIAAWLCGVITVLGVIAVGGIRRRFKGDGPSSVPPPILPRGSCWRGPMVYQSTLHRHARHRRSIPRRHSQPYEAD